LATANDNGTEKQAAFNELVEFAKEAIKHVTAIHVRTKHQPEALSLLNNLIIGLCTYAAERVTTIEGKIEEIHTAIAKTDVALEKTEKSWAQIVKSGTTTTTRKARPTVSPEKIKASNKGNKQRGRGNNTKSH